ncbi:MAG: hypothetical protein Q9169_006347 [Polycauliona sp. 2 TL-2023]
MTASLIRLHSSSPFLNRVLPSTMQIQPSPWCPQRSQKQLQQPPSEEIILDDTTAIAKKRARRKNWICLLILHRAAPSFEDVPLPTNTNHIAEGSDSMPYVVPQAFPMYPAVPSERSG